MVAIVTGNALGLSTSSLADLGQQGARGSAAVGRNGDMAYVNAATGNLVLQTQDEMLVGRGLSIESLRTYNSRGLFNDDNGDNWSMGMYAQQLRRIESPPYSGAFKFVRTGRDGAEATYVNTYTGYYQTTAGEGAHDRVYDNGTSWVWIDGATGLRETYDVNTGRLLTVVDKSGNQLTYGYDGAGQLTSIADANGEQTFYEYVGSQLRQVRTGFIKNSQFVSQTRVRYEYDTSNRLGKVTVDLTPEVDGVADGKTFVTTYGYDGSSKRVSSITHNNDTVLRLQYDTAGRVQYAYDAFDKRTEYRYETTGRTRVIDAVGAETVYEYFSNGELKSVSTVVGGNVLETVSYQYETNYSGFSTGNVVRVTDGQNNVTNFSYDSALGNRLQDTDAAGNTVTRSFVWGTNQVQYETRFLAPNPNTSYGTVGTFLTTRYVYDEAGLNRLRFVISPEGVVTEYRYDSFGQRTVSLIHGMAKYPAVGNVGSVTVPTESSMASWVSNLILYSGGGQPAVQRVDMSYDARGQLVKTTAYSAVDYTGQPVQDGTESVTQYIYDQSGRLLQTISPTGGTTSMVYDGLGRVISRVEANGTATLTSYSDASNIVEQTITQSGLKTTSVYDKAGRLVSVQQANGGALGLGESKYAYDANGRLSMTTDPTGVRHWMLYDEAGRKVADIDGNGTLVEYSYNRNGQLTRIATYATAVSTGALIDTTGKPTSPALSTLRPAANASDVYQWNAYDKAGRLVKTVNAEGAVTETFYDGANRIMKVVQYASRISTASLALAPTPESIAPTLDATRDRTIRYFYDIDDHLVGELDAEGYFTEYRYNAAGQRFWTLRYTTAVAASLRATGTFYQFVPYNSTTLPKTSAFKYYDNKGQVIAEIDAENYLTEFEYDKNGNVKRRVRYNGAYNREVTSATRPADIKNQWQNQPPYTPPESQVTAWQYDQSNRVTLMTEPDGTVTKYDYDAVGNLVRTTRAYGQGTEERALNARYDAQGRLVAELAATEAWRLTTGMTDAQAAAVFEQYGVKHSYDKAGRRTSTTDRNGLTTLYFYNEDSQLTHTVNAMGEVEERRYNALNRLEATLHYGLRLDSSTRTQLRSGTTSIASAVAAIADAAKDSKTTVAYKLSGLVASTTQQLKPGSQAVVQYLYDAFGGEIERRTDLGDGTGRVRVDTRGYDRRGLLTRSTEDSTGAAIDTTVEYDAFGRAIKTWDDAGKLTETGYDKLGRVIRTVDRNGNQHGTAYDAFDRVITQSDALGKPTTYTHNTAARSVVMLTPENIRVTTVYNRHGQTLSITDGKLQTTSYTYDKDGNLTRTNAPIASASTNQTFERGRLIEAFDANDVKVKYTYDDANRILSREVDPDGLKLRTTYEYDSSGRQIKVTDANGIVTRLEYDLAGRQVAQTVDEGAGRLNLRTEYTHDATGNVLTVTSPGGRVTQYKYDAMGRRVEEVVDPAGLALRTLYSYDHDGNVRTRTDANGAISGFAYDAQGWLQYSVDGAGGVTYYEYDKNGRVTRTTRYATAISITGLTAQFTSADIAARVVKTPGKDAIEARSYDGNGRLRFTADGNGAVVEFRYDGNGNVTDRIAYAKAINVAAWTSGNPPVVTSASDQRLRNEYDALNRLTYQADATGAVTRREYDDNGNLRRLTEYATKLTGTQTPGQVAGSASDRATVYVYDKANRETLRIDAMGAVQKSEYDNDGNLIARTNYVRTVTPGTEPANITLNLQDRVERFTYDGAGRRTYSVDAMNFVTRWTYDDAQGRRTVTRFATAIPTGGNPADVARNAAQDQTDVYLEDKAGRVVSHTDAEGETESWTYDAVGNKETFINKKGSVWHYEYDAAGRLTWETSPEVYLTTVSVGAGGKLQQGASADAVLKTHLEYDALGNLLRRTEAAGRLDAENRSEERTTIYEYDARGRQIKVTYPPVPLYGEETERSLTAQTFYDALGNAVANIDVAGRTSYKVYDLAGRVRYEVDTVGHVTGYERNTYGEAEKLTRYSVRTDLPTLTTASSVALMPSAEALKVVDDTVKALDHSHDRSISSTYDKRGRVLEVREGTVYTLDSGWISSTLDAKKTANTYNAFGEVVKTRVSGLADNAAIDTYFYYDRAGHQIAQVDAMGYLTVRDFDAAGNMTTSTEYAGKLDVGAWNADAFGLPLRSVDDRMTAWTYDRLNRKVTETRVGVSFASSASAIPAGQPAASNIVTRFGYDAVGNLTSTTDANGGKVLSYYDALGRVTAVASPVAQGVNGAVTPLTVFLRDAYGNVAVKWDLANGATQAEEFTDVSKSSAPGFALLEDADRDRRTVTQYDRMGRAIKTTDAEEHTQTTSYRANGQVGETRQAVTDIDGLGGWIYQTFEYDELGRLVATREPAASNVRGEAGGAETLTQVSYNAFGEITERKVDGEVVEFFDYDDVGQLWRTNSGDGVTRVMFYDVHGRNVAEVRARGSDFGDVDLKKEFDSAAAVKNAVLDNDQRLRYTLTEYDALGHVVMQTQPVRTEGQGGVQMKTHAGATATVMAPTSAFKNLVRLTWNSPESAESLDSLGAGELRVELTYTANVKTGSGAEATTELKTLTRSQVFGAEQSGKGVEFGWNDASEALQEVQNFSVWKKDSAGVYRLILDRAIGAKTYSVEVALPPDPAASVRLETKTGNGDWIPQTSGIRFGSVLRFDLAQLGTSSFSYQVFYDRLDPGTGLVKSEPGATGQFAITGAPVLQPINILQGGYDVPGVAKGVLAWSRPPADTKQVLNYRPLGGTWRSATVTDLSSTLSGFNTATLADGEYDYELLWTVSGQTLPTSHATGTFKVTAAVTEQETIGVPRITGIVVNTKSVSWNTKIDNIAIAGTPRFEWRLSTDTEWQSISLITTANGTSSVDISTFDEGAYQFRISYQLNGVQTALGTLNASLAELKVEYAPEPIVSNRVTVPASGFSINPAGTILSWVNTGANSKFEYRERAAEGQPVTNAWTVLSTTTVGTSGSVNISGLDGGKKYEFRITSEQAENATVTIGAGNLTTYVVGGGIPQPPQISDTAAAPVAGLQVAGQELSWNQIAGTDVKVEGRYKGAYVWGPLPVSTTNGRSRVDMAGVPPGDYEVRISHYIGDNLVAFDARSVKVYPNPSAAPYFVDLTDGRAIKEFKLVDGNLTWFRPAFAAPGTALFEYVDPTSADKTLRRREVVSNGATDSISMAGLPANCDFKVTYSEGSLVIGGGAASIKPGMPNEFAAVNIRDIRVSDGRLRWKAPDSPLSTKVFMRVDGVFVEVENPDATNGEYSIVLPKRTLDYQSIEYLIQYRDNTTQVVAVGAARVELSPSNVRADPVIFAPSDAGITNITADRLAISWDARPGVPKFEGRVLGSGAQWEELRPVERAPGVTRESVSVAGFNGNFEWRITYTDPATGGAVAAIASGTLDISSPEPVLSNLTSGQVSGFTFAPGRIRWVRPADATGLSIKVLNAENGAWEELPSNLVSAEGGLQVVDLSQINPGSNQVLITYFKDAEVMQVMRGTVTTFAPGTATANDTAVAVFPPTASDFSWTDIPGAGTPFFQYRLKTETSWRGDLAVGAPVDGKRHVNITSLDGNYEYRVTYTSGAVVTALATGQLDVVRPKPQLSAIDGAVLKNMNSTAARWSWDRPAGIGTVKFRSPGGTWGEAEPVQQEGGRDFIDAINAPVGTFEYAITYREEGFETAFSTGIVVVNPPTLANTDRADILGLTQGPASLSWTPNATPGATAKFAYRGASDLNGPWVNLDVQTANGNASVDLTGLHGSYDYRISYEVDDASGVNAQKLVALDAGRIDITTTAPTVPSQGASKLQGLTATASLLKWVARTGALKVEYRPTGGDIVVIGDDLLQRNVGGYDMVDLSRFGAIGGDFRITYTESGLVTAMAIGEINGPGWGTPGPNATANVTGVTVVGSTLSWTSTHTGTPKFFYRVNGGSWVPWSEPIVSSVNIASVLNTTAVYDYRIVYSDGAGMTALGMGKLTTTAATAALVSNTGGRVEGFQINRKQVSWVTPAGAIGSPVVFVRQAGFNWDGPMPLVGQNAVDLSQFTPHGTWEVRVAYSNGGQLTHLGTSSFTVESPAVWGQTSSDIVGIGGAAGPRMVWNAIAGNPVLEYFDAPSGQWRSAADADIGTLVANDGTGHGSFNFLPNFPPSTYSFRLTYLLNGDINGIASGTITFAGGTAAPGVNVTTSYFGASVTAGLGELRWTPPSGLPPSLGYVAYRLAGASTWIPGGAVQARSGAHFVDISGIGAGTYEFRIYYESTAGVLASSKPTVQIYAAPATVNPAMASLGSFTLNGTQLSWTAPAAGGSPVFEYQKGGNWVIGPAVGTFNGQPSVNVDGIYDIPVNFRVRYTAGGYDVAFGSGSFNATKATQINQVLASDVSNHRIEFGKLLWNRPAAAAGTATFSWRPATGGAWQSATAANESFDLSVLSSGNWSYRVSYSTAGVESFFGSGTITVPTGVLLPVTTRADIGPVTAPANGTTLEWAPSVYPGATATFKYLSTGGSWQPKEVSRVNGKDSVSVRGLAGTLPFRIEYTLDGLTVGLVTGSFSVGSTGTPVVLNSTNGEVEGVAMLGTTLSWTRPPAVGTAKVFVRRSGQTDWEEKGVSGETADLSGILNAEYEFRIEYSNATQVIATAVGTLVPQSVQVTAAATTNVNGFEASLTRLSWDKPALTGVTDVFEYYDEQAKGLRYIPVIDDVDGRRAVDVSGLGNVRYRVVYRDTATGDIKALGAGVFTPAAQPTPVLIPVVSTVVSAPELKAGRLVWERPASVPTGSAVIFERKSAGGFWSSAGMVVTAQDAAHDRIELSMLTAGTYEWRVKYMAPLSSMVVAIGSGTLVVPPPVTLSNQALGNVTGIKSDTMRLTWDPVDPSAGSVEAHVFNTETHLWDKLTVNVDEVSHRPYVDIAGIAGTFEFRISYGVVINGQRQVMALGRGTFTGTAGTASFAVQESPVGDFEINANELSWTPASGSLEVHRLREGATAWELISPVNSNGARHSLTIGDIEAGNYQYRVVYREAGAITGMARIGVTIDQGVAVPRRPAEVLAATATVTGFTVPAQTHEIRWTRNSTGGAPMFEYRRQDALDWIAAPVGSFGTQDGVDIRSLKLPQGKYQFRVQYRSGQGPSTDVRANGAGSFTVPAPLAGTQTPTLQLNGAPVVASNFVATITSLKWDAPPNSDGQRVLLEARMADETVWSPIEVTRDGPTDHVNFRKVINASTYEYRVTYTDGAGTVTALGSGVVKFGDATVSRLGPTVDITTPAYVPGHPAADADYRATLTTDSHPNAISDPRLGFTATMSGGAAPGEYALQPKITQKLDRWGNVIETTDPRNAQWKTTYKWNWANQLVEQVRPTDGVVGGSPTTRIYYDALGRQVGMQDANGNLNTKTYDLAGNLVEEGQADGGRVTHRYDALGNKVQTTDAVGNEAQRTDVQQWTTSERETAEQAAARRLGHTTDFSYDRMGRLLKSEHGGANVYSMNQGTDPQHLEMSLSAPTWRRIAETFTYDEAGRKKTQTNGNNETTSYKYDAAGHVVETRQPMGTKTTAAYNASGYQTSETDANGRTQTWDTDAWGRVESHTDLSGALINYTYDNAGLLQTMRGAAHTVGGVTVAGQSQDFKYDQAGQLLEINDTAVGRLTTYRYDAAGNRVLERTQQTADGKTLLLQDNYLGYDAQGRLRQIFDGHLSIAIDYDLNGNRKKITTGISVLSAAGAGQETVHDSVRNFAYDAMNRQTVVEEYDEKRGVVRHEIKYYFDGNRKSDRFFGNKVVANGGDEIIVTEERESGFATYTTTTPITYEKVDGMVEERYHYDNLGRLMSVIRDGTQVDLRRYDGAGRALQTGSPGNLPKEYIDKLNEGVPASEQIGAQMRLSRYDLNGRLAFQNVLGGDGAMQMGMDYIDRGDGTGYDAAGNVKGYRQHQPKAGVVETHYFTQGQFDGYVVAGETAKDKNGKNVVTSTIEYDANGHQKRVVDSGMPANNRNIYSDTAGRALLVDQGGKLQRELIVNGEVLGSYGIGLDDLKPKDDQRNPRFAPHVDFEWGYQQINGNYPGGSPGAYTVRQGDTLQGIARGAYGDSRMWYRIAEVNGLSSDSDLKVGQTLIIPTGVGGVHNASDTFEPYDPRRVIGDTSPTLPIPKGKDGRCGGLSKVIGAVVAAVVTYFTYGNAALGAMAGDAARQVSYAMLNGQFDWDDFVKQSAFPTRFNIKHPPGFKDTEYDYKSTAVAGAASYVTTYLGGGYYNQNPYVNAAVQQAVNNAATQAINIAIGRQNGFQWKAVVTAAAGGAIGQGVGGAFNDAFGKPGGQFATGLVTGAVTAIARGGKISFEEIATDAFGNALGSAAVDAMTSDRNPSNSNYRNEMDRESDAAHSARQWAELNRTGGNFARMDRGGTNSPTWTGGTDWANAVAQSRLGTPAWARPASSRDAYEPTFAELTTESATSARALQMGQMLSSIGASGTASGPMLNASLLGGDQRILAGSYGGDYSSFVYGTSAAGNPMIEHTLHRGGLTRADAALEGLVEGIEARFQRRQDDAIAASGGNRLSLAWLALRYGPERLLVNAVKGVASLPRLYTSDGMVPGLAWAASNPGAAGRAGYNAFSRLPTQDKVISMVELLGPAALKFGPGAVSKLNGMPVLGADVGRNLRLAGDIAGTQLERALLHTANAFRPTRLASDMSFQQTEALRGLTVAAYEQLQLAGSSHNALRPALSVAQDMVTGEVRLGLNQATRPDVLADALRARTMGVPDEIMTSYLKSPNPGSHAEVHAINDLLLARPGARLDEIAVYTIETGSPVSARGLYKPACPVCSYILNGVHYVK